MNDTRLLGGRYEIERHLRTSHVTHVYQGIDRRNQRPVAIEVLRDIAERRPGAGARFKAAGDAAASLSHPNMAKVVAAEEAAGLGYVVREHLSGPTLQQYLADQRRLPPARAAAIALQACDALAFAHRSGLVHQGLTPSDVLLTESGEVKLAGFGFALSVGSSAGLDTRYAPPEQLRQPAATGDPRADLYALGSCLYEMLLGRPPFVGDPQMLERIGPRIPAELAAILRQLLATVPGDRYQQASDVASDLRCYLGLTSEASDPPRPSKDAARSVGQASRRAFRQSAVVLTTVGILSAATVAITAHQLGVGFELVVGSRSSSADDIDLGTAADPPGQSGTQESSTSSSSTSVDSTTTEPSTTTTTTDPDEDEVDDETDLAEAPEATDGDREAPADPEPGDPPSTTSPPRSSPTTSPPTTAPPAATVPSVIGMTEGEAASTLAAHDLGMSSRRVRVSDSRQDGRVVAQAPGGGAPAPSSGTVNVDVGRYCFVIC